MLITKLKNHAKKWKKGKKNRIKDTEYRIQEKNKAKVEKEKKAEYRTQETEFENSLKNLRLSALISGLRKWLLIIDKWLIVAFSAFSVSSVAVLGTPYGEQRTPSHGDLFGNFWTFWIMVRIIDNIFVCRISYVVCRILNWELCHWLFIIYYWLFLCGSNNSVNRCKSVSNRKLFEKTNPIYERAKLTQNQLQ